MENNPNTEQLEKELRRTMYRKNYRSAALSTFGTLLVVAAIAVLVSMLVLPVIQITGSSMTPTVNDGEILVALRGNNAIYPRGDICVFYYNNKLLVKRIIAFAGEWVNIDAEGNVFINDVPLDEPYLTDKALGDCNIQLPYQVPDGKIFVMGDHRATSADSRNTAVGCVSEEQMVGRVILRIWPFNVFGPITFTEPILDETSDATPIVTPEPTPVPTATPMPTEVPEAGETAETAEP